MTALIALKAHADSESKHGHFSGTALGLAARSLSSSSTQQAKARIPALTSPLLLKGEPARFHHSPSWNSVISSAATAVARHDAKTKNHISTTGWFDLSQRPQPEESAKQPQLHADAGEQNRYWDMYNACSTSNHPSPPKQSSTHPNPAWNGSQPWHQCQPQASLHNISATPSFVIGSTQSDGAWMDIQQEPFIIIRHYFNHETLRLNASSAKTHNQRRSCQPCYYSSPSTKQHNMKHISTERLQLNLTSCHPTKLVCTKKCRLRIRWISSLIEQSGAKINLIRKANASAVIITTPIALDPNNSAAFLSINRQDWNRTTLEQNILLHPSKLQGTNDVRFKARNPNR